MHAAPASLSRSAPETAALAQALAEAAPHLRRSVQDRPDHAPRVAVLLPCLNEEISIGEVVRAFRAALPQARVIVFDNGSTDNTAPVAAAAGAEVVAEPRRGKGNVVRRMFAEVEADVYLMADGDGTYDAAWAPALVETLTRERLDMVVGARAGVSANAHRTGHALGNRLFNRLHRLLFNDAFADVFSGYRAFSRRFVKSFPAASDGFEIETELSVHAGLLRLPVREMETPYGPRAQGSASKLRSVRDGARILKTMAILVKETRPMLFFGALAGATAALSLALAAPILRDFALTGLVPRLPTAVLCTGLALIASLLFACGLILDSLARARVEQKRMFYLAVAEREREARIGGAR